ncbi:IS3 family transposase [Paenibacillus larvae]|nr:IS3 family transposase [Paenibacillus larvae]
MQERLMELISSDGFAYGYRKLTVCLRREYQLQINKKKVYRLCKKLDNPAPTTTETCCVSTKTVRNQTVTGSTSSTETDIKYGFIAGEERFFFILSCIDVYDRSEIVAFHIGLSCEAKDVTKYTSKCLDEASVVEALESP